MKKKLTHLFLSLFLLTLPYLITGQGWVWQYGIPNDSEIPNDLLRTDDGGVLVLANEFSIPTLYKN